MKGAALARRNSRDLTPRDYERLLERLYFSVVSVLYREIRKDVKHKIDLLPTAYTRAVALFYEAQDYETFQYSEWLPRCW